MVQPWQCEKNLKSMDVIHGFPRACNHAHELCIKRGHLMSSPMRIMELYRESRNVAHTIIPTERSEETKFHDPFMERQILNWAKIIGLRFPWYKHFMPYLSQNWSMDYYLTPSLGETGRFGHRGQISTRGNFLELECSIHLPYHTQRIQQIIPNSLHNNPPQWNNLCSVFKMRNYIYIKAYAYLMENIICWKFYIRVGIHCSGLPRKIARHRA